MPPVELHFLRPHWLWLLLPLGLLLWQLSRAHNAGGVWRGLVDAHLLRHLLVDQQGHARRLPLALLGIGWAMSVLALAGPAWERLPQPVYQAQQYRVVLLDLSPSMNATDVAPSRLAWARFEVLDLLREVSDGQTAMIAYGSEPYVVAPLTTDTATIALQVPALETALLPVGGPRRTDLALREAGRLLQQAGAPHGDVILVTDGLSSPAAAVEAAAGLASQGYRVSILAVGTEQGAPVPAPGGGFAKDARGSILVSQLDPVVLRAVADAAGGSYVAAVAGSVDTSDLLSAAHLPSPAPGGETDVRGDQWREVGPWLLLILLPLVALAFRRGWISPLIVVVLVAPVPEARASDWVDLWQRADQRAMQRYSAGDAETAARLFERDDWRAAAAYAAGDYEQALTTLDKVEAPAAAYNRGNALARLGRLEEALEAYRQALAASPDDADARHNHDLVKALLEQRQAQQSADQSPSQSAQPDAREDASGDSGDSGDTGDTGDSAGEAADDSTSQVQTGQDDGESGETGEARNDGSQGDGAAQTPDGEQEDGRSGGSEQQPSGAAGADSGHAQAEDPDPGQENAGIGSPDAGDDEQAAGETPGPADAADAAQAQADGPHTQAQAEAGQDKDGSKQQAGTSTQAMMADTRTTGQARAEAEAGTAGAVPDSSERHQPGLSDLLGREQQPGIRPSGSPAPALDAEGEQAIQQMLRRVEDDPSGLLRQRFLLQHLRRQGRLP